MTAEWHYGEEEPSNGPVSLEELKQLVASGQVQPTYMVWKAGMPEWLPAGEVEDLFPKQATTSEPAAGQQPPVPPTQLPYASHGSPRRLPSLRTAVVGLAAFCVIGLIVAASFMFFPSKSKPGDTAAKTETEEATPEPTTEGEAAEQESEDLPEKVQHSLATLKTSPADPEANLVVGKYHCLQKDDWDKGLPMLAQGSDAALKQLAAAELAKPTAAEEQKKLGDGWWEFAGSKVKLAWKGSLRRAVYWYRKAVGSGGGRKAELEQRIAVYESLPDGFMIVSRRTNATPEYSRAICTHLSLEVNRTEKLPEKPGMLGVGIAGLELKGAGLLELKVKASPELGGRNRNIFAGFMVDYQTAQGYTKRVALSIGPPNRDRVAKLPLWGKHEVPDDFVDLDVKDTYQLDLQQWAPPGWTGQAWFGLLLQQRTPNTFVKAELVPHTASPKAAKAEAKVEEEPPAAPSNPAKGKKRREKSKEG